MRTFFVLAVLFLLSAPALAAEAPACQCTEKALDQRIAAADAVFAGAVVEIRESKDFRRFPKADPPVVVTLKVDEAYKGVKGKESFQLHTSLTRHTCTGHPFEVGKMYLVFAYKRADMAHDFTALYRFPAGTYDVGGLCGGTKLFEKAGQDLKSLKPEKPGRGWRFLNR